MSIEFNVITDEDRIPSKPMVRTIGDKLKKRFKNSEQFSMQQDAIYLEVATELNCELSFTPKGEPVFDFLRFC